MRLKEGDAMAADWDGSWEFTGIDQPVELGLGHADAVKDHGCGQKAVLHASHTGLRSTNLS